MRINLSQANNRARQLREQAAALRSTQSTLASHQRNLNAHWRGEEMAPTNGAIEQSGRSLTAVAIELDSISSDIIRVAEAIKREEEVVARAASES